MFNYFIDYDTYNREPLFLWVVSKKYSRYIPAAVHAGKMGIENLMEVWNVGFGASGNFCYYISFENCIKMSEHTDMFFEMWVSHMLYLNDKEEYKNGLKLIDRKVEDP